MTTPKERLDTWLVQRGHAPTRERAKAMVMAGNVFCGTQRLDKPGMRIPVDADIVVKGQTLRYVSRGGLKLEHALSCFGLSLAGHIVLDIGASTGGFTDCALQHGASYVYAVDVGYNQLAWPLRNDDRVNVMERTNFRYCTQASFLHPQPTIAVADVSFISLRWMIPPLRAILETGRSFVSLIKPQFEAGRAFVGKTGVIRDARVHEQVLRTVIAQMSAAQMALQQVTHSPIMGGGGDGNIEFLAWWTVQSPLSDVPKQREAYWHARIVDIVAQAHQQFGNDA